MPHWARNNVLHGLFKFARTFGCSPEEICAEIGLDPDQALAADALVPQARIIDALEWCGERSGRPTFGLMFGARLDPRVFCLPVLIAERCRSIEHFYVLFARNLRLHTTGFSFAFSADETGGAARMLVHSDPRWPVWHFAEGGVAMMVDMFQRLIGPDWRPRAVEFAHARMGAAGDYQNVFGAPVTFNAGRNALLFSLKDLEWRANALPREGAANLDRLMQDVLLDEAGDLTRRVAEIIRALLPTEATLENVAAELSMSSRALQRRLAERETSFTTLRTEARVAMARQYLSHPGVQVSEVAARLGFSHASVLSRLLRQELGAPPRTIRLRRKGAG